MSSVDHLQWCFDMRPHLVPDSAGIDQLPILPEEETTGEDNIGQRHQWPVHVPSQSSIILRKKRNVTRCHTLLNNFHY